MIFNQIGGGTPSSKLKVETGTINVTNYVRSISISSKLTSISAITLYRTGSMYEITNVLGGCSPFPLPFAEGMPPTDILIYRGVGSTGLTVDMSTMSFSNGNLTINALNGTFLGEYKYYLVGE